MSFSELIFIEFALLLFLEIDTDAILLFGMNYFSRSIILDFELWYALELSF